MNRFYSEFVSQARAIADARGLEWNIRVDATGKVDKLERWDLCALAGVMPTGLWLSLLGPDDATLAAINAARHEVQRPAVSMGPLDQHWRDLYQASLIHQIVVKRNKPRHALAAARWLRHLGVEAEHTPPWSVTPDHVRVAYNAALKMGQSGKNALNFEMVVRMVFDVLHLADIPALARHCRPHARADAIEQHEQAKRELRRAAGHNRTATLRKTLSERKSAAKLPEQQAFWELVRIVFSEAPMTLSDAIRFDILKILIITGLRINEILLMPLDWKRWHDYVDADGTAAGDVGGVSRSLSIRYFAEKQDDAVLRDKTVLYESTQHVPTLFQDLVVDVLEEVERLTSAMRKQVGLQAESGRLFPELPEDALVPAWEMYIRASGNVMATVAEVPSDLVDAYRVGFDLPELREIRASQSGNGRPGNAAVTYWSRARLSANLQMRTRTGAVMDGRTDWRGAHLRVSEVEAYIRQFIPTKLPDLSAGLLADGSLVNPDGFLFLMPTRNVVEARGGVLDPELYFSVGRASSNDIDMCLDGSDPASLFARYGEGETERGLRLNTHSLRHLQNTELFRLGVADTIITKRFGRGGNRESSDYDHRSLAEDLEAISLPEEAEAALGPNAAMVYRMILANGVSGPVVDEFKRIQRESGDDAAFEFLGAEADGLHVTPYGLCVNSFSVDPCPKYLECFNGCRNLARSRVAEETRRLETLAQRVAAIVARLEALPPGERSIGWKNQLKQAQVKLANIRATLACEPGERPFPEGPDLSKPTADHPPTVLDTIAFLEDEDD